MVINGHGPNFELLQQVAAEVSEETGVKTLVFNWWSLTADIAQEIYGDSGGHAGSNETGAILATNPEYVHPQYYRPEQAWSREEGVAIYPYPKAIVLYREGEGYPDFDQDKARRFYAGVLNKVEELITLTVAKWKEMSAPPPEE